MGSVERFFGRIEQSRVLPSSISVLDAVSAVLCTLSQRVTAGEARDFVAAMPPDLEALLAPCVLHRDERPETFGRVEFLRRVADHLRIEPVQAEALARAVFAAMNEELPRGQIDDVESQLPPDLKDLWRPPEYKRTA
jgi:uncharacterized protein (DUF2267 family)